ncbi:MAG: IMP dehydrogenase [Deltaproteobacteria bacterium CG07_land_8_20_14_0_80_60_11]|nr:MAG: IMP dehydrogenase [Deltaproteobacteria bacterium CG07_land_8_20_14_0_80_60_11]
MSQDSIHYAYTFDDLLLLPGASAVLPSEADLSTRLTRRISLNIPLISSAMDTVTEADTAISLARQGGIGILHRNMTIEAQALEAEKVKKSESGMIIDPVTIGPEARIADVLQLMERYRISGIPVVEGKKLVGIVTNRDLRFETNLAQKVKEVMTKDHLVTAHVGITLEESKALLHKYRIEKLLVVDDDGNLNGLITIKDIEKIRKYPLSCKDEFGRLRVGAAIGVGPDREPRLDALIRAGVDVICIDTAHGHSRRVIETVADTKRNFPEVELIAGNIATAAGARDLIKAGADAVKIGVGPGSICTTRVIAGVGVPQISAIMDCARAAKEADIPLVADGGIKYSGDVTKALAAGADVVMIGSLFAGTDESPGETVIFHGRSYKIYRGMGSLEAMKAGSRDRYCQEDADLECKLVPEGIVGRVPSRGKLSEVIYQLMGGLRSGMGYVGARNIMELQTMAKFIRISAAGLKESHVHDVIIMKEAPNYWVD